MTLTTNSPVLVTGCAGFIGSHLVTQLLRLGHHVIGLDNLNNAYPIALKQHRLAPLLQSERFHFYQVDIEHASDLQTIWEQHQPGLVFHLGARAGVRYSMENPHVYFSTNVTGTLNVLECMRRFRANKIIFASTSSIYGDAPMPFVETAPANQPPSPYAASKKSAEALLYSYGHLYDITPVVLRFFTVYGPAGRPDMGVLKFIHAIQQGRTIPIYGDGTQQRDFTYIDDIVQGILLATQLKQFEVVNLGNNRPVVLNELIRLIELNLGKQATRQMLPVNPSDAPHTWANIDKARQLLQWEPQTNLATGVAQTVKWYQAQSWLADVKF